MFGVFLIILALLGFFVGSFLWGDFLPSWKMFLGPREIQPCNNGPLVGILWAGFGLVALSVILRKKAPSFSIPIAVVLGGALIWWVVRLASTLLSNCIGT